MPYQGFTFNPSSDFFHFHQFDSGATAALGCNSQSGFLFYQLSKGPEHLRLMLNFG